MFCLCDSCFPPVECVDDSKSNVFREPIRVPDSTHHLSTWNSLLHLSKCELQLSLVTLLSCRSGLSGFKTALLVTRRGRGRRGNLAVHEMTFQWEVCHSADSWNLNFGENKSMESRGQTLCAGRAWIYEGWTDADIWKWQFVGHQSQVVGGISQLGNIHRTLHAVLYDISKGYWMHSCKINKYTVGK